MRLLSLLAAASLLALPSLADQHGPKPLSAPSQKDAPAPTPAGHEIGQYRFGATYRTVESSSALSCQGICGADKACYAWSYVRATYTVRPRCELKRSGGQIEANPAAISGYSPMKEQQPKPVHVEMKGPQNLIGGPEKKLPAGTVVTSQAVPLGATPTITYKPRYEVKTVTRYPVNSKLEK